MTHDEWGSLSSRIVLLEDSVHKLEGLIRYMANTLHQNYHPEGCGWQTCDKPLCHEAQKALGIERLAQIYDNRDVI